jgi:hypothetical protein
MNHTEINETLFEHTIRIENLIYLAGALTTDSLPPVLNDLIEEDPDRVSETFPEMPSSILEDEDSAVESVREWLVDNQLLGFMVQVATPVMTPLSADAWRYSWGYYRTQWIYAETLAEALSKATRWADECRELERERAK